MWEDEHWNSRWKSNSALTHSTDWRPRRKVRGISLDRRNKLYSYLGTEPHSTGNVCVQPWVTGLDYRRYVWRLLSLSWFPAISKSCETEKTCFEFRTDIETYRRRVSQHWRLFLGERLGTGSTYHCLRSGSDRDSLIGTIGFLPLSTWKHRYQDDLELDPSSENYIDTMLSMSGVIHLKWSSRLMSMLCFSLNHLPTQWLKKQCQMTRILRRRIRWKDRSELTIIQPKENIKMTRQN